LLRDRLHDWLRIQVRVNHKGHEGTQSGLPRSPELPKSPNWKNKTFNTEDTEKH
jgi:hypothetical protein